MPKLYDHGDSFRTHHPDWEHHLWTDDDLNGEWQVGHLLNHAEEYAPGDAIRFKVDVLRIEILAWYGGVYVDCDAVCRRPLDPLLNYRAFAAQSPNRLDRATNAIMGCEPGHPLLLAMLGGLPNRAARFKGCRLADSVGPGYLTDSLNDHDMNVLPWWLFAEQTIRDRRDGRPADPRNAAEGFVTHLWGNSRRFERQWVPAWARRLRRRYLSSTGQGAGDG